MSIPDDPFNNHRDESDRQEVLNDDGSPSERFDRDHPPKLRLDTEHAKSASPPILSPTAASETRSPKDSSPHSPPSAGTPGLLVPGSVPGTKTPRRVQWTSDSHIVSMHEIEAVESNTVDETNLRHLDSALERHRSRTSARRRPPSMLSSAASSAGDIDEGEDYDYRLDVDPPPLHAVTSAGSQREAEPDSLQTLLGNDINQHVTEYIPLGETDGLPNVQNSAEDHGSAAKDLVRAHTGKWGVLRRRVKGAGAVNRAFGANGRDPEKTDADREKEQNAFAARYPEPEDNADGYDDHRHHQRRYGPPGGMNAMPQMPQGASVLSSLLALYGQQQDLDSATTSAASSRPGSDEDDSEDEEIRRKAAINSQQNRKGSLFGKISAPPGPTTPPELAALETKPAHMFGNQNRSRSTSSLVDRMGEEEREPGFMSTVRRYKKQFEESGRPKAARSGAGVFGALLQNTANLSGVATPAASALTPAARRPGYQLSRYSMPSLDGQTQKAWRPPSRPSSRTGSRPSSVHSSTAVSTGSRDEDSPRDGGKLQKTVSSYSTDDMLSMKEGKPKKTPKTIRLDSLHKLPGAALKEGGHALRNAERFIMSGGKTPLVTPPEKALTDYFTRPLTEDELRRRERDKERRRRKKAKEARKKQEIYIIQHVAAYLSRQQFVMKLARALMMFGSPSHRLETQIQATARVLEINAQVVYLPGTMLISFGDDATHTSETKFLKQATGLDLGKLLATHNLYWNVIHDKMSVEQASKDLDVLMTSPVYYNWWQSLIIAAACSAFITVIGFNGSFIDALVAMPLGMLLVGIQMLSARNDMFSNVFEIAIATLISFLSAALASTGHLCYTALVSGGVVLILPGYIVLTGALELASRNITAGSVRIGYSVIYSLFLGFGISIGAEFYRTITGLEVVGANNYTCEATHAGAAWYQSTPSGLWWILCAPGFATAISMRNQQPIFAKELPVMVLIACAGWASNHFSGLAFKNRSDMTSAIGSFVVGTLGNIYGRFTNGSSFPVTVAGILFQLPSGLSNGGIFNFAASSSDSDITTTYSSGFNVAQQLVAVAIGLTVGLFVSAVVTHPLGGGKKRGSGIFSF